MSKKKDNQTESQANPTKTTAPAAPASAAEAPEQQPQPQQSAAPEKSHQRAKFDQLASELESHLQKAGELSPDGAPNDAAHATVGGFIAAFWKVVTSLRSGDVKAILAACVEVLSMIKDLIPDTVAPTNGGSGGGDVITFQQQAALAGFDWKAMLKVIILEIMPLLFELAK